MEKAIFPISNFLSPLIHAFVFALIYIVSYYF